jgi:hypothetical protein
MMRISLPALAVLALAGCSEGSLSAPASIAARQAGAGAHESVVLCHQPDSGPQLIEVSTSAREAHLAHGDYVARLVVDPATPVTGDRQHFARITDAVLAARALRIARRETTAGTCRITIAITPGTFTGSFDATSTPALERFPIIIDVPDVSLSGATRLAIDASGRATSDVQAGGVTTLVPNRPIVFTPVPEAMIVVAGHPGGFAGDGTLIEGLDFQSGRSDASAGGIAILALRAGRLVVRGNRFEHGITTAADLRASDAHVDSNYADRLGANCTFCFAGPGDYTADGNRLLHGDLGGIFIAAVLQPMNFSLGANPVTVVEPFQVPAAAAVVATIRNNDIRGHVRPPVGFGVRVLALGPGMSNIPQVTTVSVTGNELTGNAFGLILDGGFPAANTLLHGDLAVTLGGNNLSGNCQANLFVAFTRHTGGLGITTNPYLLNSTYRLTLAGDVPWSEAWYANPPGKGNTLVVDGAIQAPGSFNAYDPLRSCT